MSIQKYNIHQIIAYQFVLAHGTFIGSVRLEANKPTQLHINSLFRFGASTRHYILRERPNRTNIMEDIPLSESTEGMLGLPESQTELDVIYMVSYKSYVSFLETSILF